MTRVVLAGGGTGGHLFPAIAIADAIRSRHPEWEFLFAGSERGVEASVLPRRGLPHRLFPFQPLHRRQWWRNASWPLLAGRLVRSVDRWLAEQQPDVVIGTGGYVSGPVVWRAGRRGIPTALLELDARPGLATRLASGSASQIWLGAPEALEHLPPRARPRAVVTGAPIIPPDRSRKQAAVGSFGINPQSPVIVVTGGSQGSLALNRAVAEWLRQGGGAGRQVIWATGKATFAEFAGLHAPPSVHVVPFLDPIADAWAVADVAIARAGMMTLAELAAWGIPAILVPLPTAAADHQHHNAVAAAGAGAAVLLPQQELDAARLDAEIKSLVDDPVRRDAMSTAALARGRPNAASEIAERVAQLLVAG